MLTDSTEPGAETTERGRRRTTVSRRLATCAAALAAVIPAAAIVASPAAADTTSSAATPPPITVTTGTSAPGQGDLFLTPTDATTSYPNGAEIATPAGKEIWFHQAPTGDVDADFRPQTLHGRPVLTFWEGTNFGGLSDGTDYIYNDHYQQIAAIHAGDGLTTDGHEFQVTNQGTAWVLSYDTATVNLSSINGPTDQSVIEAYVQEIDIRTGRVLFSWNAADHVPYSQSEQPLPTSASTPWDWFHVNAVKLLPDGNLLVDARDTWTTYKVSGHTGQILWQLGGKDSSFKLAAAPGQSLNDAGEIFSWQHDPEQVGPDEYTVFDNESAGVANTGVGSTSEFGYARVVTIKLNQWTHTATLVASDNEPQDEVATSQGNGQRLPGGGELIGWGILPDVSEFDASGNLVFNAEFPTGVNTYRAYLLPWNAPAGGGWGQGGAGGQGGPGGHAK
jgi:Arylsulfotransferase (ASST)